MRRRIAVALVAVMVSVGVGVACKKESPPVRVEGSVDLGEHAIVKYGCGSCHTIPGIKGADALVGPPLVHFRRRTFIAGQLKNSEANLRRWITDPQGVEPGTAMPDLDVTEADARNIAAYLESLD
jgi:cytochrome c1